jgi:hypothetical protein
MAKTAKSKPAAQPPTCPACDGRRCRLTDGAEIYPHRRDLHTKPIWVCDVCRGYVGCHPGTTDALGTPADAQLRRAREILHNQMIDPLWQTADACGEYAPEDDKARHVIRQAARGRVYRFLADHLEIPVDQCHVGMFDLDQCRRAWIGLRGVTYPEIRKHAHQAREEAERDGLR